MFGFISFTFCIWINQSNCLHFSLTQKWFSEESNCKLQSSLCREIVISPLYIIITSKPSQKIWRLRRQSYALTCSNRKQNWKNKRIRYFFFFLYHHPPKLQIWKSMVNSCTLGHHIGGNWIKFHTQFRDNFCANTELRLPFFPQRNRLYSTLKCQFSEVKER